MFAADGWKFLAWEWMDGLSANGRGVKALGRRGILMYGGAERGQAGSERQAKAASVVTTVSEMSRQRQSMTLGTRGGGQAGRSRSRGWRRDGRQKPTAGQLLAAGAWPVCSSSAASAPSQPIALSAWLILLRAKISSSRRPWASGSPASPAPCLRSQRRGNLKPPAASNGAWGACEACGVEQQQRAEGVQTYR